IGRLRIALKNRQGPSHRNGRSELCCDCFHRQEISPTEEAIMFSDAVLDHFRNPRNAGELHEADATVEVSNPVCGDVLKLAVRLSQGHVIEARFLCRGCTTSIACASLLTEQLRGKSHAEFAGITAELLAAALGGLPPVTFHGAQLAADATKELAKKLSAQRK